MTFATHMTLSTRIPKCMDLETVRVLPNRLGTNRLLP